MKETQVEKKSARFDMRLTEHQKNYFEKAALLGNYRNLTDFVMRVLQEKSDEIMAKEEEIIASIQDQKTFFDEVTMPQTPNRKLAEAAAEFKFLFRA